MNQISIFTEKLQEVIESKELIKLTISNPRDRSSGLKCIIITIVKLKAGFRLNFINRYHTKDIAKNYSFEEAVPIIEKALQNEFYNADLFTKKSTVHLKSDKSGSTKVKIKEVATEEPISFNHDKKKQKIIVTEDNIYLKELGITNANWEVRREMSDKFRQINKYIELLDPVIKELSLPQHFNVADMGSGKGYLTFALYDHLVNTLGLNCEVTGVEQRDDLVKLCNDIAAKANFNELHFIKGTIDNAEIKNPDILLVLHACDTATDDAIYKGITSNASLIVVAPCCHKQLRKEFNVTNELDFVLKHGILLERQAEIITDGIRAMLLEAHGYNTKVFEFISTEHTPKNVMIVGRKVTDTIPKKEEILEKISKIMQLYGIHKHYLEELLREIK